MKKFNLMQVVPSLQSGGVEQGTIDVANYLAEIEIKNYFENYYNKSIFLIPIKEISQNIKKNN